MVKKIKSHDGQKLDRIQDHIGIITSMVLSDKAISVAQSGNGDLLGKVAGAYGNSMPVKTLTCCLRFKLSWWRRSIMQHGDGV